MATVMKRKVVHSRRTTPNAASTCAAIALDETLQPSLGSGGGGGGGSRVRFMKVLSSCAPVVHPHPPSSRLPPPTSPPPLLSTATTTATTTSTPASTAAPLPEAAAQGMIGELEILAYRVTLVGGGGGGDDGSGGEPAAAVAAALAEEVEETLGAVRELEGCGDLDAAVEQLDVENGRPSAWFAVAAFAEASSGGGGSGGGGGGEEEPFCRALLREAASRGHVCAAAELAARLFPSAEACALMDAAARRGHPRAHLLVAQLLEDGNEALRVPADPALALKWLRLAAASYYPAATYALGQRHEHGRELTEAYRCFSAGAARGHIESMLALGKLYLMGRGVLEPRAACETAMKAEKWLKIAARQGSTEAVYLLGRLVTW